VIILFVLFLILRNREPENYDFDYDCFLLSLPESQDRRDNFFASHNKNIPIEVIYGENTKIVKNARKYEDIIVPEYFEKAIEMHYNPTVKRPDITYFNLGAIGAYMGHTGIMKECMKRDVKYALILEDNVIIKSDQFYREVQETLDTLGDDFEMCFFHCLSRTPIDKRGKLEKVVWISSMKCYLVNVENMRRYMKYYFPIDNHVDNKTEDIIDKGARVFYKDLRQCLQIDRRRGSTIGHSDHGRKDYFSRVRPTATPDELKYGY
jgi:GR25 family glycosyltransferase involved in LPS biosynthesis